MTVDLDFKGTWTAPAGNATDLDFGLQQEAVPDAVGATLRIRLGPPTVCIRAGYTNQVSRKLEGGGQMPWQRPRWQASVLQDGWGETGRDRVAVASSWQPTVPSAETTRSASGDNIRSRDAGRIPWQGTEKVAGAATERFDPLSPRHDRLGLSWGEGGGLPAGIASGFVWLVPHPRHLSQGWRPGVLQARRWRFGFAPGVWRSWRWTLPWQIARQPSFGESHLPVEPPVVEPAPRHNPDLDFLCRSRLQGLAWRPSLSLDFGTHPCPQPGEGGFSVPILKVYFVSNSVELVRLPGREPIPVKGIQLSIDADSWAWGFSANLPYPALELVEPTASGPVEIEISINGVTWVMVVEGFDVRREFGQASLSIRGRSPAAYLAEPYAPKRSFMPAAPFTARQLAEQELTRAGLVTGFTLDWQLPDWLVPAGSWGYQSLTPMGVIGRITEAVGGCVFAHPRLRTLVAKSRYPVLPWNWAKERPDRTLPIDVVKTLNLRWRELPAFNAVYVCGERDGVTGHIVRAGTAGDVLAATVVEGLITHADAARERGRVILADVGRQAMVTLELPMLEALGLLDPGLLIAVGEGDSNWRGLVRGTRIAAEWNESLTVRQTIEVERHYL
ncbi:ribosome hibernation promoting factor [Ralstonia solanacearum]|nr:ribosome hibernation promoting factor [Ralstonia solanacearum]